MRKFILGGFFTSGLGEVRLLLVKRRRFCEMSAMPFKTRVFLFSGLLASAAASCFCQVGPGGASMLGEVAPKWHLGVTAEASATASLKSDLGRDMAGSLGVYGADASVKFQGAYDMRHFVTASFNYGWRHFDFSEGGPFENADRVSAFLFYTGKVSGPWSAVAFSNFSFGASSDGSLWGGRSFMGGIGASYRFGESLTAGFGGAAYSRVDNTWIGIPVAFVDWKITGRLTLRTFSGAVLLYDLFGDDSLVLSAAFEYKNDYYRLAPAAGTSGASLRRSVSDSFFQFSVGATYRPFARAYVSAFVGADFDRTLKFRSDGASAEEADADAAPVFSLNAGWNF